MRVVLDTNIVVSGLPWDGRPRRLLEFGRDRRLMRYSISKVEQNGGCTSKAPQFTNRVYPTGNLWLDQRKKIEVNRYYIDYSPATH